MPFILNGVYLTLMLLASPWILWAAITRGKYREGFAEKLLGRVPRRVGNRPCVWLHAVSMGEVNLLETTLASLRQNKPEWTLVISTTTKTGYDLACKKYGAEHTVFYCPLDFSWAVKNAMQRVRPNLLVLAELELWPNLIRAASDCGAKVAIINGRLSDNSFRGYRRLRPLVASLLRQIDLIAAQNAETAERFRQLGAPTERVVVTGSLKFDGAITDRDNLRTRELRKLADLAEDEIVFLAGSTQAPEEQYAIEIFQALAAEYPALRLVLVPRHPERFEEVAQLLERSGVRWARRSRLRCESLDLASEGCVAATANDDNSHSAIRNPKSTILVDTVGELSAWWGTATIGFVGGSFGSREGQNMLEPAAYGVATCFGPKTRNFRDIVSQLLAACGAEVVQDRDELEQFVRRALNDPTSARQLGQRGRALVLAQQGATERTVELLQPLVARKPSTNNSRDAA
ncbi:MAG: 3-deoxy-D-manno-octulosonic acid transferase [Planctomycetes bacterium]|nr:3-deoxy-D-manno-octulosonic acid transferase [Planctomycetota bacterium]